jgi:hypothetical protein
MEFIWEISFGWPVSTINFKLKLWKRIQTGWSVLYDQFYLKMLEIRMNRVGSNYSRGTIRVK